MGRKLVVGPWVGELGWEVMKWQGYVRRYILDNIDKYDRILILGRPGHKGLYLDGSYEFDWLEPELPTGPACCELCNNTTCNDIGDKIANGADRYPARRIYDEYDATDPKFPSGATVEPFRSQVFVHVGRYPRKYRYVIHARCNKPNGLNIPESDWVRLVEILGPDGASIGITGQALHIPGTKNMMDLPLETTLHLMACVDYVIGSDSGPMHLAALTYAHRIVIAPPHEFPRYNTYWRPFPEDPLTVTSSIDDLIKIGVNTTAPENHDKLPIRLASSQKP